MVVCCKRFMNLFAIWHALQVLDHFMTEVGQRFTTRTEERLLAVVYTLQQCTYKTGLPSIAAVPEGFKKELAGEVSRKTPQCCQHHATLK
jgi:hypothetical protein